MASHVVLGVALIPLIVRTDTGHRNSEIYQAIQRGCYNHGDDPMTYKEAISDIDSSKWIEAMKSKMNSMYKNQVWDLVDPLEGIVPIENKWVFKKKIDSDGKVKNHKARLVAKGFCQRQGIDY